MCRVYAFTRIHTFTNAIKPPRPATVCEARDWRSYALSHSIAPAIAGRGGFQSWPRIVISITPRSSGRFVLLKLIFGARRKICAREVVATDRLAVIPRACAEVPWLRARDSTLRM